MNEAHTLSPYEYTDEEFLHTVQALKRHGHGTLTLEAHDQSHYGHRGTAPSSEGASRGHIRRAMAIQNVRGDPSTDARVNDPFRAVGPGSVVER